MLAMEGRRATSSTSEGGGEREGLPPDSRSTSRVPWLLLDELDAEKQKLLVRENER